MKNQMFLVCYKETPTGEVKSRKIIQHSNTSKETMRSILRYEEDVAKNQLEVLSITKVHILE